jgi:hypothetical protein
VYIPRIQTFNTSVHDEWGGLDTWFPEMETMPAEFYVSDGDPETLSIPKQLGSDGPQLNPDIANIKIVVRY